MWVHTAGVRHAVLDVREIRYVGALIGGVFNDLAFVRERKNRSSNIAKTALALRARQSRARRSRCAPRTRSRCTTELCTECDRRIDRFRPRGGAVHLRTTPICCGRCSTVSRPGTCSALDSFA